MPKRRFRPVRRRRRPSPWVWAGFAASATLGALTATLVAGGDDQPNPTATTQLTAGQLSDEVRRMITGYLEEEGYPLPEEPDVTEPDVAEDPDLPVEPPVPIEAPAPVAPAVAPAARTSPVAKTTRPGAGPWPIALVPDVVLPRVEAAIGAAPLVLPPAELVEAADVPVALWQARNAPTPASARGEQASDPAEPLWEPEPAWVAASLPAESEVAPAEPLRSLGVPVSSADPAGPVEVPVELGAVEVPEFVSVSAEPLQTLAAAVPASVPAEPIASPEPVAAATHSGKPAGRGAPESVEPAGRVRSEEPVSSRPHRAPEVVEPADPAPSAELRVDRGAKSVESAKHGGPDGSGSRHSGGREVGGQVAGDADAVTLPAGE